MAKELSIQDVEQLSKAYVNGTKPKQTRLTRNPERIIASLKDLSLEDKAAISTALKEMIHQEREAAIATANEVLKRMEGIEV